MTIASNERLVPGTEIIYIASNPSNGVSVPAQDFNKVNGSVWTVHSRYQPHNYSGPAEAHYFINERGIKVGPYYSGLCEPSHFELLGDDDEDCV